MAIVSAERIPELSKYVLLEEIGHGGMATVYRARDPRLGREVAVKLIHRHLREHPEVAARFVSEARAVAKLKHPNIVEVHDVSDPDSSERFLVVELVRGTTLRCLISDHGKLPAEVAAAIGFEVASALDHAHRHGVIHRDVKPENVLLELPVPQSPSDEDRLIPRVKITDFGIAKLLDAQGVTSTGQVLGSPAHMAPEQIEAGEVSARSDVFGLGVLLYEAMVGKLPFEGKNPAQVLRRVLDGVFVPVDRADPTVGLGMSAVLSRALARRPEDRFSSALELAEALRAELANAGFEAPRLEIYEFLKNPKEYLSSYTGRIVGALMQRAERARAQGQVPLATHCLNRALAFRPGDSNLLSQVGTLARRQKRRVLLIRGGFSLGGAAGLLLLVLGASKLVGSKPSVQPREAALAAPVKLPPEEVQTGSSQPEPGALLNPAASEKAPFALPPSEPARRPGLRPVRGFPSASPSTPPPLRETRLVRILVNGPKSATVKIDGREVQWFGPPLPLETGPHIFEFLPPNDECCEGSQVIHVEVLSPREPGDEQVVRGTIRFRPATVEFRGSAGGVASCGELGSFPVPSQHRIPMANALHKMHCTLLPPAGSAVPPREYTLSLSPGGLFTVSGS